MLSFGQEFFVSDLFVEFDLCRADQLMSLFCERAPSRCISVNLPCIGRFQFLLLDQTWMILVFVLVICESVKTSLRRLVFSRANGHSSIGTCSDSMVVLILSKKIQLERSATPLNSVVNSVVLMILTPCVDVVR
jgi:hypothetical protein